MHNRVTCHLAKTVNHTKHTHHKPERRNIRLTSTANATNAHDILYFLIIELTIYNEK